MHMLSEGCPVCTYGYICVWGACVVVFVIWTRVVDVRYGGVSVHECGVCVRHVYVCVGIVCRYMCSV